MLLRSFATFSHAFGLQMSPSKINAYFNGVPSGVKKYILQVSGCSEESESLGQGSYLTLADLYWNYLWDGTANFIRVPMVSWDKLCAPKEKGGLGIKDSYASNNAAMGKLVWWIFYSPDRLWVKWVHQVYLKDQSWHDYNPKSDGYTIGSGYELLWTKFSTVSWHKHIWNNWSIPKHCFIGWLIAREALQLKGKHYALGITPDGTCLLCGSDIETDVHLFQQCIYSRKILEGIAQLCRVTLPSTNLVQSIWRSHLSQLREGVLLCMVLASYYHIGMQRNKVRMEACLLRPELMIEFVRREVKNRLAVLPKSVPQCDEYWLRSIQMSL
ncbi:uncharacterized protein LOC141590458 [Silene latifolia]|uniref:uncharacterized protein LOC141590458 n=1 Tax=Silene latifolia TaxID=37657 RepID=UPI003D7761FA